MLVLRRNCDDRSAPAVQVKAEITALQHLHPLSSNERT
jgi:hypothetical protein